MSAATGPFCATAASTAMAKSPAGSSIESRFQTSKSMKSGQPSLRYRMPAEWEPHTSTWLTWPHYRDDWPGKFEPIPWVYAEIIRHLTPHERVDLIVNDAASEKRARKTLKQANAFSENIRFHRWPTD